ncbi:Dpy-30 motif-containing protein [Giardia muris]|uniref:Dpy-30 motif-containing protein n=1 Tax=Giardia muris TaxID=5742 RepID=A0A4Z1T419_GIAMU|nr:Dpy-30 motif-containing protein [Giardia muris]|eukprot:TNJ27151.1 Dpy-30 motif-containing protein [Giardia muris]
MTSPEQQPANNSAVRDRIALEAMTTRAYLDETVVPVIMQGLAALVQERPENPVQFLGEFLLLHSQDGTQ